MKKLLIGVATIFTLAFSTSAFAAGYGAAGCGLGSVIFGNTPGIVQVLAATTNGIFGNQMLGITFGTSNCDSSVINLTQMEQEEFVQNNFASLSKEMAAGDGESLNALAGLLGCATTQQARFGTTTQRNYAAIFASDTTTPAEMLSAVKVAVSNDADLSGTCIR